APLLEQFPRGCKRLLEALDLVSDSFAMIEGFSRPDRGPLAPARDSFHRDVEMALYGLFDGVLFINDRECSSVAAHHPGRAHFIPMMMPLEDQPATREVTGQIPATVPEESFDLIFVGSGAETNVRGLTAFYRQVYVPYLRRHRVRLAVIGNVCSRL